MLASGEGKASISDKTAKNDFARGVVWGAFRAVRDLVAKDLLLRSDAAFGGCEAATRAVLTARPVNGKTVRTSGSESGAGEEESLDISQRVSSGTSQTAVSNHLEL